MPQDTPMIQDLPLMPRLPTPPVTLRTHSHQSTLRHLIALVILTLLEPLLTPRHQILQVTPTLQEALVTPRAHSLHDTLQVQELLRSSIRVTHPAEATLLMAAVLLAPRDQLLLTRGHPTQDLPAHHTVDIDKDQATDVATIEHITDNCELDA